MENGHSFITIPGIDDNECNAVMHGIGDHLTMLCHRRHSRSVVALASDYLRSDEGKERREDPHKTAISLAIACPDMTHS